MASASLAEGAHVPVAATAVRAVLTPAAGPPTGPASAGRTSAPGRCVPGVPLTADGGGAGGASDVVDLPSLPADVARVLFRVDGGDRCPGMLLRLVRAADGAELARVAPAADAPCEGGELYRTDGRWAFRPAPPAGALSRRVALRGRQAALSLLKYGAADARARVVLVMDASGGLSGRYARGVVADVAERTAAVAAVLAAGRMRAWTYASRPARLPDCAVDELHEWLPLHVRAGQLALLGRPRRRARGLRPCQVDMRWVGVQSDPHRAVAEVRAYVRDRPAPVPTLVVFLSGGGVRHAGLLLRELREAAEEPLFWQFVGVGRADHRALARLGAGPGGGPLGNAAFFAVDDVARTPDAELYDRLLCAFPAWLASARGAGAVG
ncbi:VWA domain-containing protein [Streptomyces montanisoli]|uniref:VWA domain-containing protein n=1 Tax=Streptomyces montanisoli TaxID=2798581 RepID=A0A940MIR2_9ACTN|nr:VWA domain-containing protein [Streptomyces montanisoli]MBP0460946.1 VWA domain-containing protein [Streptomyces montanisoli]